MKAGSLMALAVSVVAACIPFAATEEAPVDAGTAADGAASHDSATTETSDTCAELAPTCATATRVVVDFESEVFPPPEFELSAGGEGRVTRGEEGYCAPGSLRAEARVPANGRGSAAITRWFAGSFSRVRIRHVFRGPLTEVAGSFVNVGCSIRFAQSELGTTLRMYAHASKLAHAADVAGSQGSEFLVSPVTLDPHFSAEERGTWRRFEGTYTVEAETVVALLSLDGAPPVRTEQPLQVTPTGVRVTCGISHADSAAGTHVVDLDDIMIELCP
jgi:hypothetical protein